MNAPKIYILMNINWEQLVFFYQFVQYITLIAANLQIGSRVLSSSWARFKTNWTCNRCEENKNAATLNLSKKKNWCKY